MKNIEAEVCVGKQEGFFASVRSEERRAPAVFFNSGSYLAQYTNCPAIAVTDVAPLNPSRISIDAGVDLDAVIAEFIVAVTAP
jgi:hypothetical protein